MKTIVFMLLTAVLATPAMARNDNSQAATPKKEKQICKRVERTSSHMSTRVCRTAAEWAGTSMDTDQDSLELLNNVAKTGCTGEIKGLGPPRR